MATEKLLGIDGDIPERAVWIRMLMAELSRMASHLLFLATNGMDLGAVSMMIYGWREREEVLRFIQKVTGLRMNHNYIRPGGVAADLPAGWRDDVLRLLDLIPERLEEYDTLMTGQPIWRERLQGVGVITAQEALALGATGPILRSHRRRLGPAPRHAVPALRGARVRRHRRQLRRLRSTATRSGSTRCASRCGSSTRSSTDAARRLPHPGQEGHPAAAGRIDESMEALIHHFKIFTEGFKVPEGEVYVAVESAAWRDRLLHRVSDGSAKPYRMHMRAPSFVNIQCLPHMMRGGLIADAVAVISSRRPGARGGGPLMARLNDANVTLATRDHRPLPEARSALIPLLHLSQEQNGYVTNEAMAHIAELLGVTPAEVSARRRSTRCSSSSRPAGT